MTVHGGDAKGIRDEPGQRPCMDDDAFLDHVAERLASLPGVQAVSLGGSRAKSTHRPDSDWDFAVYYRGRFEPQALRNLGWSGEVAEVGGCGGGVFNGGAWLVVDERRTDVHYRDLDVVDQELAAATEGRFRIEPLMFHLAGIPSYLVLAELAVRRVLRGQLPTAHHPAALRERAPRVWWDRARLTFDYARVNHAPHSRLAQCAGLVAQATSQAAHAVLAARGTRRMGHQRQDPAHPRRPAPGRPLRRRRPHPAPPRPTAGPRPAPPLGETRTARPARTRTGPTRIPEHPPGPAPARQRAETQQPRPQPPRNRNRRPAPRHRIGKTIKRTGPSPPTSSKRVKRQAQGLRARPPYPLTWASATAPDVGSSGRQRWAATTPGSTSSSPPKNRSTAARPRMVIDTPRAR